MGENKDLYEILGIKRDSSDGDIKSTYRKLAKEWHPDKHKGDKGAEKKFKEINLAYEVLSDKKKRQQYDAFGSQGTGPYGFPGGSQGVDMNDFNVNFGGGGGGAALRTFLKLFLVVPAGCDHAGKEVGQ